MDLSVLPLILKSLMDPDSRKILKIGKEVKRFSDYLAWYIAKKVFETTEIDGVTLSEFNSKIRDPHLARALYELLETWKYVRTENGVIKVIRSPPERGPVMTAPTTLEVMPIFHRILDTLPEAMRTGKKTFYWKDKESKLIFLRFLDNTGYNFVRQVFARWIGVPDLDSEDWIVDVGSGMGLSALTLLKLGKAKVLAVDPDPLSLSIAEDYAKMAGVEKRLLTAVGRGEELYDVVKEKVPLGKVKLVTLVSVLHWADSPEEVLKQAGMVVSRSYGKVGLFQGTWERKMLPYMIVTWLLGSKMMPEPSELNNWMRAAGLEIERYTKWPFDMYLLRARSS